MSDPTDTPSHIAAADADGKDREGPPRLLEVSPDAPQFQVSAANPARVEKGVAVMFIVGMFGFMLFGAAYWQNYNNFWLGTGLAIGFLGLGIGMIGWGKYLMPQGPFSESRHPAGATVEEREAWIQDFSSRGRPAIERRSFLLKILAAAGGVFGIVAMFPLLRSLGPLPKSVLYTTAWRPHDYLTTAEGGRVHETDLDVGGVVTVFPPNDIGGAMSQTMLIRVGAPTDDIVTAPDRKTWGPKGYVAYSKVCTHAGCPVALYQRALSELLCPCHQSLFEVGPNPGAPGYYYPAEPVFGPAPRPLPQLPLYIDSAGYLRAQHGFDQPVGPGFFERGDRGIPGPGGQSA